MAEKELIKKHVLILGDAFYPEWNKEVVSALFAEEGIDLDLRLAKNEDDASAIIDEWKTEGIKPDIISVDYEEGKGIDFVRDILEKQNMLPEKLFIHSNAVGSPTLADRDVATRLSASIIHVHNANCLFHPYNLAYDHQEREIFSYMNKAWGINLPLSKREALQRNNTIKGMLPVEILLSQWHHELRDYGKDILELLDINDIKNIYSSAALENETELEKISDIAESSLPNAINGTIAYSIEEAQQFAAQNKSAILVADTDSTRAYLPVMGTIAAMVSMSPAFGHSQSAAIQHGVTSYVCSQNMNKEESLANIAKMKQTLPSGTAVCINENGLYKGHGTLGEMSSIDNQETLRRELSKLIGNTQSYYQENGLDLHINAENGEQVTTAISQGVNTRGIGLVRTENMLSQKDTLPLLQEYLLIEDEARKQDIINMFQARYKDAFHALFTQTEHFGIEPVNIRLLDTKLEEIFPEGDSRTTLAATLGISEDALTSRIEALQTNDDIGAGFALKHPEFYAMQARAAFAAQKDVEFMHAPSIMIPLVRSADELAIIKENINAAATEYREELNYNFGAMIETKEAVADAANIAKITKFLSFGTNDLTASILGINRYDAQKSAEWAEENNARNPFISLVPEVIEAMNQATIDARSANPYITISMCGDHASDKASIEAARKLGLNSISVNAAPHVLLTAAALEAQGRIAFAKMLEQDPSSAVGGDSRTTYSAPVHSIC